MKYILLSIFILSFVSCMPEQVPEDSLSLSEVVRFEPLMVTVEDNERINAICSALLDKEDILDVIVTSGKEYLFDYGQKGCQDSSFPSMKRVTTSIQRSEINYFFRPKENDVFGFPDVETTTKGVLTQICANTQNLMNPMQTSSAGALWFTTFTSSEHCQSDAQGICIHLQRGSVVNDFYYKIHTNEWLKIKITNDNRGFFKERKLISTAACSGKGFIEKRASLK